MPDDVRFVDAHVRDAVNVLLNAGNYRQTAMTMMALINPLVEDDWTPRAMLAHPPADDDMHPKDALKFAVQMLDQACGILDRFGWDTLHNAIKDAIATEEAWGNLS